MRKTIILQDMLVYIGGPSNSNTSINYSLKSRRFCIYNHVLLTIICIRKKVEIQIILEFPYTSIQHSILYNLLINLFKYYTETKRLKTKAKDIKIMIWMNIFYYYTTIYFGKLKWQACVIEKKLNNK